MEDSTSSQTSVLNRTSSTSVPKFFFLFFRCEYLLLFVWNERQWWHIFPDPRNMFSINSDLNHTKNNKMVTLKKVILRALETGLP